VRRRLGAAVVVVALLLGSGVPVAAAAPLLTPSQKLARARAEFERGEYKKVADTLEPELLPTPSLREKDELTEAYYLVAVSFFYARKQDRARQWFTALLFLDPTYELNSATESPEVYAFFEGVRKELSRTLAELERQKREEEAERLRPKTQIIVERTIVEPSPWSNFVPFGYGQFRNGQPGKGAFFLVSEAALGGASLALFTYQAVSYGIPSRYDPTIPGEADKLETLQIVQITTGAAFLALYGWQVVDAFVNQRPRVTTKRSEVPIEKTSLVVPLATPDAVGAAWVWRF
jgi:hypothetical protein